ncbi:MAG TPA: glutamine--fructose-6-phosphate transaminase (isomerizing) [Patescibacteria group bacterium]
MCGIFAYLGNKNNASQIVVEGLKRLDYRGYDSWGVVEASYGKLFLKKKAGKISEVMDLSSFPKGNIAIAHTRWATTGEVNDINAHPHYSSDESFALAQNGIVENYELIKKQLLAKGYKFVSQTDTEVIVRLIEEKLKSKKKLQEAVRSAFKELEGRNTIILITKNGEIIAARNGSPLVVGINKKTDEIFISSDTLSFANLVTDVVVMDNNQMVILNKNLDFFDITSGKRLEVKPEKMKLHSGKTTKGKYKYFMLKEIHEGPFVIEQLTKQNKNNYIRFGKAIKKAKHVYTIGSGGAGVAAAQVAFYLRSIGKIQAVSLIGADAIDYIDLFEKDDIIITISQSGETADVLEVLEKAQKRGVIIASFVNMPGSMITRMSTFKFMSESGPEICVMSTKTFDAQVAWGYLVAKTVAGEYSDGVKNLKKLSISMKKYLSQSKNHSELKKIAKTLVNKESIFLLAKYQNFHISREGMVKIIEASYKHGHALPSGDLKHYVITLMEEDVPVIALVSNDVAKSDIMNAIDEVRLRGAKVIAISPEPNKKFDKYIKTYDTGETSAIMNLIPLQLISCYLADFLGNNIDKPRNIAKSVTVK